MSLLAAALLAALPVAADAPAREREVALALSAGPAHFASEAGVYVLEGAGFVKVRDSRNGFHCIVERSEPGAVEPQCLDAEGSQTVLPRILMAARLRAAGRTSAEVQAEIGAAYRDGRLRAPRRPGINYMLSKENRVPMGDGRVAPFPPHLMFYAPYLTNADLGSKLGPGEPLFVIEEGSPGAYVIVPVSAGEPAHH